MFQKEEVKQTTADVDNVVFRICLCVFSQINCEDDCGVLKGCWEGPYIGGVSPSHWSGSYTILKQWFNMNCHPVKYGQCWVFAGVMCSGNACKDKYKLTQIINLSVITNLTDNIFDTQSIV